MTPEDSGGHIRKCSDRKLRTGFRALYRTQLARQETGYPYLLEPFPERYSLGGADDRIGAGVHGKVRIREPALCRMAARRHRPQTHAHRFGTHQRER